MDIKQATKLAKEFIPGGPVDINKTNIDESLFDKVDLNSDFKISQKELIKAFKDDLLDVNFKIDEEAIPANILSDKSSNKVLSELNSISLDHYDNSLMGREINSKFINDVSEALDLDLDNLKIYSREEEVIVKDIESGEETLLSFSSEKDKARINNIISSSNSSKLSDLGKSKGNIKPIKLENYENGLLRSKQISLFKEDISRLTRVKRENLNFKVIDDVIVLYDIRSNKEFPVSFSDSDDEQRILSFAKESASSRISEFGQRKNEFEVSLGALSNSKDLKNGTKITQSIKYHTFIGDSAKHKLEIEADTNVGINGEFGKENINKISIGYKNTQLPFSGTSGEVRIKYENGKFKFDGEYEYLDIKVDAFVDKLKEKDKKAIMIAGGGVLLVAGGIFAATKILKEKKDVTLPVKLKVFDNGKHKIKAGAKVVATVGEGELDLKMKGFLLESTHYIKSGTNFREKVSYDMIDKTLDTEFEANFSRTNIKVSNRTDFNDSNNNKTIIRASKGYTIGKVNLSGGLYQEFDKDFKSGAQGVSLGGVYTHSDNFNISVGTSLSKKDGFGGSLRLTKRF